MCIYKWKLPLLTALGLLCGMVPLYAARIFIPKLELFFGGHFVADQSFNFSFVPEGEVDIILDSGSKIGAEIGLGFTGILVDGQQPLNIDLLALHVGRPVEDDVYLTLFHGELTDIGSGDDFSRIFNSRTVSASYRGRRFFPLGQLYNGLYTIRGSGLEVGSEFGGDMLSGHFYLYRDSRIVALESNTNLPVPLEETYAVDVRLLVDTPTAKFDLFIGTNFALGDQEIATLRGGAMMFIDNGSSFELYSHIGVPWFSLLDGSPGQARAISLSGFQFILEPRFTLVPDIFAMHFTAFWNPSYYNNQPRDVRALDLNTKFLFGAIKADMVHGGIDVLTRLDYSGSSFSLGSFEMSPFLGISGAGAIWEFALKFIPFQPLDTIEFSVSASTALE